MTRSGYLKVAVVPIVICIAGYVGYALYFSVQMTARQESLFPITLTFWDSVLMLLGEARIILYWTIPLVSWITLRTLQVAAQPATMARYPTRSDWTISQVRQLLPVFGILTGALLVVALVAACRRPFVWTWSHVSANADLLRDMPALTPLLPFPVLVVALIMVATVTTLAAVAAAIAASATGLSRPRLPALTAVGITIWGIASFFLGDRAAGILGVNTYLQPILAAQVLRLGPAGGVTVLLVVGVAIFHLARLLELRSRQGKRPSKSVVAVGIGPLALLGLGFVARDSVSDTSERTFLATMLQGTGTEGFQFLPLVGNCLIVLPMAMMLHRRVLASLDSRRFSEMIRIGRPDRWYTRQLARTAINSAAYSITVGIWLLALLTYFTHQLPQAESIGLSLFWTLALLLQIVVATIAMDLGTVAARRAEGGAYALGAIVAMSLPLGQISHWLPAGQPSLIRLIAEDLHSVSLSPRPLLVMGGWIAMLGIATAATLNRTRGELS